MRARRLAFALMLAMGVLLCAGAGPREAKVEQIAQAHGVNAETPGFAVLVIEGGKVVLRHGFGLAELEGKRPIHPDTTFELASLSKTFTGTAICILHDRGKLSFDDQARKYIPELPEGGGKRPILISNLLHHTSGLPDYTGFAHPKGSHPGYVTNEDYVQLFARKPALLAPRFQPGDKYEYCNTNYLLLALIVERVSKRSFGEFLHDEVFKPLGMEHSWVNERPDSPLKDPRRGYIHATGYAKKNGAWTAIWGAPPFKSETMLTTGDGAVWSSVEDLALFDAGMHEGKLLKPATWKQALTPSRTHDGKVNPYGFGWVLELDEKGRTTSYGHEGSWGGFHTAYYRYTGVDRAVVVLSNREDFKVGDAWVAIDALYEEGNGKRRGGRAAR